MHIRAFSLLLPLDALDIRIIVGRTGCSTCVSLCLSLSLSLPVSECVMECLWRVLGKRERKGEKEGEGEAVTATGRWSDVLARRTPQLDLAKLLQERQIEDRVWYGTMITVGW